MACPTITTIPKTECIGNSLVTINSNFSILRDAICSIQTGISVSKDSIQIGTNIKGLNFIGNGVVVTAAPNETAAVIINSENPLGVTGLEEQSTNGGGGRNNFFILRDGSLRVVGSNTEGELGVSFPDAVTLPRIAGFSPSLQIDEGISKIYTHCNVTYVITTKGRLYGAGYNRQGQLGQGNTQRRYPYFVFINVIGETQTAINPTTNPVQGYAAAPSDPVVQIATGTGRKSERITLFARTQSGALYAWGDNSNGQSGIPNVKKVSDDIIVTPQRTYSTGGTIVDVQSGGNNGRTTTLVKDNRGKVFVIGSNTNGQAGIDSNSRNLTAFQEVVGLPANYTANKIRVGGDKDKITVWITLTDGTLWAAGQNNNGQASGNSNTKDITKFTQVAGFDSADFVVDVVAHADNNNATCWALIRDGDAYSLKGWGNNGAGQLGLGTRNNIIAPSKNDLWPWLQIGAKVKQIVIAGADSEKTTLVLDTLNNLWAAGDNRYGLCGRGDVTNKTNNLNFVQVIFNKALGVPTQIRSTNNSRTNTDGFFCGNFLALLSTNKVLAWGFDDKNSGQLGVDATPRTTAIPALVMITT